MFAAPVAQLDDSSPSVAGLPLNGLGSKPGVWWLESRLKLLVSSPDSPCDASVV